ncbi:Pyruvate/Phosphoenolpyruvate kinase-like domain-containing protein [Aspergillus filifer]
MLPGTDLTRTMSRSAPTITWHLIDLGHGNIYDDGMHDIVAAFASCGVSPIVRVAEDQHSMIKRALDSGAHGILVPMIESPGDARMVVEYSKFPPLGKREFEALLAVDKFVQNGPEEVRNLSGAEYLEQANDGLVIANVHGIAAVEGINVLFIGPFHLDVNIGHSIRDPEGYDQELDDAIQTVLDAGKKAGKAAGNYCDTGSQGQAYAQ